MIITLILAYVMWNILTVSFKNCIDDVILSIWT